MVGSRGEHNNSSLPQPRFLPAAAVAVVAAGLIAGLLLIGSPTGGPSGPGPTAPTAAGPAATAASSPAATSPTASQRPTRPGSSPDATSEPAPSPTPAPDAWTAVTLPPLERIAELRPQRSDAAGVAIDSAFTLISTGGDDPTALAARLTVTPPLELDVAAGRTASSVTIRPRPALTPGRVYRFELRTAAGALAGSWAFQAQSPLQVVTTLPGDQVTGVPTRTGIEVTFDQDGVGSIKPFFSITPAVHGRFEQHGRTQVFVPDELKRATVYTVTIRRGVARTGSEVRLERDVRFQFETAGPETGEQRVSVLRQVVESGPDERPVLGVLLDVRSDDDDDPEPSQRTTVPVSVYRIPTLGAAVRDLRLLLDAPAWTASADIGLSTAGLTRVLRFTGRLGPVA
ncbi:MAG: alpha-2-macroglobulin domain protein, partial [Chloroflexi bacterium]|nr:alpha-2-macroglobulin domain protein [Chloroflexota bacterium]